MLSSKRKSVVALVAAQAVAAAFLGLGCSSQDDDQALPPDPNRDASTQETSPEASTDGQAEGGTCVPATCASAGADCGVLLDGCGGTISCGGCDAEETCGAAGPNQCGMGACDVKTCETLGADCGLASDSCGGVLNCGGCAPPEVCGGLGVPNSCACTPLTCSAAGAECGFVPDGCDGALNCGSCSTGQCGGGGAYVCGTNPCTPKTCAQQGASCGTVSDGCAAVIDCGDCQGASTCGGGGVANQCGCVAKSCVQLGASCGDLDTGCGVVNCGGCAAPETCGGGGISNACGCSCNRPNAATSCAGGVCTIVSCVSGWEDCDGSNNNGCERSLSSPSNCGACGNVCGSGEDCVGGACRCGAHPPCGFGQYCYQGDGCYDLPTMTWTPGCMDVGVDHLGSDYLYEFRIYGRPGAIAQKYNQHVSCGTAAYEAEALPIDGSGSVGDTLNTSAVGCIDTLGSWDTWAVVDGYETNHALVTFYSSLCAEALTCSQANSYCL